VTYVSRRSNANSRHFFVFSCREQKIRHQLTCTPGLPMATSSTIAPAYSRRDCSWSEAHPGRLSLAVNSQIIWYVK
jgi:hypothetical protein